MAHRLVPGVGTDYLQPARALELLCDEFPICDGDLSAGADHVHEMIAQFLRMKAGYARWKSPPPHAAELDDLISKLAAVTNDAIMVTVADSATPEYAYLNFAIVPGEPLIIGYCCQQHEVEAAPLVQRLASTLGYVATFV